MLKILPKLSLLQENIIFSTKFVHTGCLKHCLSNSQLLNVDPNSKWQSVVGLEIHAQIDSTSKLFSASGTEYLTPPNMQVSFFDAALPGTLPVLNRRCVEAGVLTALALNCNIHEESSFDRKHYFYADMPAGYQITQQRNPLATDGYLDFVVYNSSIRLGPYAKRSRLLQLQLEQDSGKSLHDESKNRSLIDLNRAGIGLMELVFDADLKDGEECAAMVKELQLILKRLGTCSGHMDEGALRVDANISVNRLGEPRGVRTEVKNLNSMRFIARAVDYEIARQIKEIESGGKVVNETRTYDMKSKLTFPMRDKEEFQDYRFMPEPNLPPLRLTENEGENLFSIGKLRKCLPPLPQDDRKHLMTLGVREDVAIILVNQEFVELFCTLMKKENRNAMLVANWLLFSLLSKLNDRKLQPSECPVSPSQIDDILELIETNIITKQTSGDVLALLFDGDKRTPLEITEAYNWRKLNDDELKEMCETVMKNNASLVKKLKKGKIKYVAKLMLAASIAANGRGDPNTTKEILLKLLQD